MWVEQTKKGKYKYIERYTDPLTGKYRRVSVVLEKNTRQAKKQAQEIIGDKIRQAYACTPTLQITLTDLVEKYRTEQKSTVKASTYSRNYFACESLKRILGPDTQVDKLNAGYIRQSMLATGKEPGTMNEHLVRLKALLRWGYKNDLIYNISYLDKLERFQDVSHREKIQDKFIEGDEAKRLIYGMNVKKWRDLTEFLLLSGARFGEAAAIKRSDIDLKTRKIHISKTYDPIHDIVTPPKTSTSIRDVYMQDELYVLCRRLVAESTANTIISINSENLLFSDDGGEHIKYYAYNKYLAENSVRILGRSITPHTLRHTHASLMMENGMSEDAISRRLGHTNSKITKEIYLHATNRLKERENDQIKHIKIL